MGKKTNLLVAMVLAAITACGSYLYLGKLKRAILVLIIAITASNMAIAALVFVDAKPFNVILFAAIILLVWLGIMLDTYRVARRTLESNDWRKRRKWYYFVGLVVFGLLLSPYVIPVFGEYEGYKVTTGSMEKTVVIGDYVLADLGAYRDQPPARGDVVLMYRPDDESVVYIKRCVAIPSDTVEFKTGSLYVNGKAASLPSTVKSLDANTAERTAADNFGPYVVPDGQYFVIGDNLASSYDSRHFGSIPENSIFGRAVRIYLSSDLGRMGMGVK